VPTRPGEHPMKTFDKWMTLSAAATALALSACSGEESNPAKTTMPEAGSNEGGTCTVTGSPGADDAKAIQSLFDDAKSGDTICLANGTYKLNRSVTLQDTAKTNVTVRGTGSSREDVVLDFAGQIAGVEGVLVTANGFTIENLWIKNTAGNGIKVQADDSVFRKMKVSWDTAPDCNAPGGPGYAIYPTGCNRTLMEDNEVVGASDAGIYAGQCLNVIARRNNAHGNVLGIEIENTTNAEIYDNDVYDNSTGLLLDLLPTLKKKDQKSYLVHNNHIHDNNHCNFAEVNTTAAVAPQGTGILVVAASDIEITGNNIENNDGTAIVIVSYNLVDLLQGTSCVSASGNGDGGTQPEGGCFDPDTKRYPERIYAHDNTFAGNGLHPKGVYTIFGTAADGGPKPIPYNVLWDGWRDQTTASDADAKICLGTTEAASFVNFHAETSLTIPTGWTTDSTAHQCTLPPVPHLVP
jgi:parallel beta-helix repeat protein